MELTKEWLKEKGACSGGFEWWCKNGADTVEKTVELLIADEKFDWASWLLTMAFSRKNKIRYAIFAAEQVLDIFEKKYPADNRPRKAIEAARVVLENDTKENRASAAYAASVAYAASASYAAYAAYDAYAASAAYAAYDASVVSAASAAYDAYAASTSYAASASYAAYDASVASAASASYAASVAYAASAASAASRKKMQLKIVLFGVDLFNKQEWGIKMDEEEQFCDKCNSTEDVYKVCTLAEYIGQTIESSYPAEYAMLCKNCREKPALDRERREAAEEDAWDDRRHGGGLNG